MTPAASPSRPAGPTHVRWWILAILFAASFVAYVLRTNMSVAGEAMMTDLGLTQVQLGFVLSAFAWGYAIFQFPGGVFGDLIGARRALALIAVLWGALTVLMGLVPSGSAVSPTVILAGLVVLRFLMGAVQAPVFPIVGGVIGSWFPPGGWALPNGLSVTGLTLGAAATGPLVAGLMTTIGWRQSFVVTAPLALAVAAAWWWYARDSPAEHARVGASELALIAAGRTDSAADDDPGAWKLVLRDRNVQLLTASYFCMNYVFYVFFNWFFIYLVQVRGFAALEGGTLAAAPWLVGAFFGTVGGVLVDRLTVRFGIQRACSWPCLVALPLVALLLFAGATAPDPYVAVVFLSLCFGLTQMTDSAYWAGAISVSPRHAAAVTGVMNTGGNVVGGIGALLVPVTAGAFGWVPALATGSVFALVGAALWLWIRVDAPLEVATGG